MGRTIPGARVLAEWDEVNQRPIPRKRLPIQILFHPGIAVLARNIFLNPKSPKLIQSEAVLGIPVYWSPCQNLGVENLIGILVSGNRGVMVFGKHWAGIFDNFHFCFLIKAKFLPFSVFKG
jgi:hypothetical protein